MTIFFFFEGEYNGCLINTELLRGSMILTPQLFSDVICMIHLYGSTFYYELLFNGLADKMSSCYGFNILMHVANKNINA